MLSKILGNGEDKAMAQQVMPPARQARGEQYARALNEFEELQRALDDAVGKLDDAIAHIKVQDGRIQMLESDNDRLTRERDWFKGHSHQIWVRLQDAGHLIMRAMETPNPMEEAVGQKKAEPLNSSAIDELEREIAKRATPEKTPEV